MSFLILFCIQSVTWILNCNNVYPKERTHVIEEFMGEDNVLSICMEVNHHFGAAQIVGDVHRRHIMANMLLIILLIEFLQVCLALLLIQLLLLLLLIYGLHSLSFPFLNHFLGGIKRTWTLWKSSIGCL